MEETNSAVQAILRSYERQNLIQRRDPDEDEQERDEDMNELSDLDLMGRFERFTS